MKSSGLFEVVKEFYKEKGHKYVGKLYPVYDDPDINTQIGIFISIGNHTSIDTMNDIIRYLYDKGYESSIVEVSSTYDDNLEKYVTVISSDNPVQYTEDLSKKFVLENLSDLRKYIKSLKIQLMSAYTRFEDKNLLRRISKLIFIEEGFQKNSWTWDKFYVGDIESDPKVVSRLVNYRTSTRVYKYDTQMVPRITSMKIGLLVRNNPVK